MASFFLAPDPVQSTFFIPGGATPGNGAQLFIYVAGSVSTPTTVYKDNAGAASWTNPIVLDSGGNLPLGGVVWIPAGVTIKAVWAPSNDTSPPTSPYRTIDNIAGINDTTASATDWIPGPAPTFISSTQFTLVGDQTTTFTKSRRLKFTVTAGTVYGTISSSSFGAVTTVNVAFSSGALDAGLSSVFYSLIDPSLPSVNSDYSNKQASTVASAANGTTNIWGLAGDSVHVSGTNPVFNFSSAPYAGARRKVIFDGILGLMSSAALTMQGNLNVTTAVNDMAEVYAQTTSTNIITFYKASGRPVLVAAGDFAPQASNTVLAGPSSGANAVPTFRTIVTDLTGVGMFCVTSAVVTSAVAVVDFTSSSINNIYDDYLVTLTDIMPLTDNVQLLFRVSQDNGSTFKAGANDYSWAHFQTDNAASTVPSGAANATAVQVGFSLSNTMPRNYGGELKFWNPAGIVRNKMISFYYTSVPSSGLMFFVNGGGMFQLNTSAVNGIRFLMSSGNISSGIFSLYGMKRPA